MVTNIRLYGILGKRFGRHHRLAVETPAEAVRAISRLKPGFERTIRELRGVDFGVRVGTRDKRKAIGPDRLAFPSNGRTITITPVIRGAAGNKGWYQVIAGVVLIAASAVIDAFTYGGFGASTGYYTYLLGASLIIGGVAQLLTPTPKAPNQTESKTLPSYLFSNIVNTIGQGESVPVFLGGPGWIGSAVVSGAIETVDAVRPSGTSITGTSGAGTGTAGRPIATAGDRNEP